MTREPVNDAAVMGAAQHTAGGAAAMFRRVLFVDDATLAQALVLLDVLRGHHDASSAETLAVCAGEEALDVFHSITLPGLRVVDASVVTLPSGGQPAAATIVPAVLLWLFGTFPDIDELAYLSCDVLPCPCALERLRAEQGGAVCLSRAFAPDGGKDFDPGLVVVRRGRDGFRFLASWLASGADSATGGHLGPPSACARMCDAPVLAPWTFSQTFDGTLDDPATLRVGSTPVALVRMWAAALMAPDILVPCLDSRYAIPFDALVRLHAPYARLLGEALERLRLRKPNHDLRLPTGASSLGPTHAMLSIDRPDMLDMPDMPLPALPHLPLRLGGGCVLHVPPALALDDARHAAALAGPGLWDIRDIEAAPADGLAVAEAQAACASSASLDDASIDRLAALFPRHGGLLLRRAQRARGRGDAAEAERLLRGALEADRHLRTASLELADMMMEREAWGGAVDVLSRRLDMYPRDAEVLARLVKAQGARADALIAECVEIPCGYISRPYEVTSIVSAYCSEAFMRECLDDLEGLSVADRLEIVVVDAASPEDEGAIVREYGGRFGNIRLFRAPRRISVYEAWNVAVRIASGTSLTPFSTNDRLRSTAYEILLGVFAQHPSTALAFGNTKLTSQPHGTFDEYVPSAESGGYWEWPDYSFAYNLEQPTVGPHPLWRRSLHDELGLFDERYQRVADQDFFLRVGRSREVRNVREFTGLAWLDSGAVSRNAESVREFATIQRRFKASLYADIIAGYVMENFVTMAEVMLLDGRAADVERLCAACETRLPGHGVLRRLVAVARRLAEG
ncbi:hypothetical protein GGQ74_002731 [Desulfobaculum xiamenense]|uniref:Glycosyltransferase 2-like domain-containing protein n=1 Tax=Desulfobaculum xiamenense TaxID=995050 RepID=A0A846QPE0_9BACT|nr:glycosyltransferase [Desulfobaculum xiamenense]NJB69037.1 hypothetical protein [Desulfobaculum xiamenense]